MTTAMLGKKRRLNGCLLAVVKVAEADADEAEALPRIEANTVQKR